MTGRLMSRTTFAVVASGALLAVLGVSSAFVACSVAGGGELKPTAAPPAAGAPDPADGPPQPAGQDGWQIVFGDEFDGPELDLERWTDTSSAEADSGRGNKSNKQLEWNQAANCKVGNGEVVMTARRERVTSPSGERYDWTSCLLSSTPSYAFQFGFIEERAVLPKAPGFWPAFWTWQAPEVGMPVETDVYELYTSEAAGFHLTQHSQQKGRCQWKPTFDPSAGWHTYGAAIEPSGTTWYVDGVEVCRTSATSEAPTNIISNLAVHSAPPPPGEVDSAAKRVDYIRAWTRG